MRVWSSKAYCNKSNVAPGFEGKFRRRCNASILFHRGVHYGPLCQLPRISPCKPRPVENINPVVFIKKLLTDGRAIELNSGAIISHSETCWWLWNFMGYDYPAQCKKLGKKGRKEERRLRRPSITALTLVRFRCFGLRVRRLIVTRTRISWPLHGLRETTAAGA